MHTQIYRWQKYASLRVVRLPFASTARSLMPALVVALPLLGFLINGIGGLSFEAWRKQKTLIGYLATLSVFIPFVISVFLFLNMSSTDSLYIKLFTWIQFEAATRALLDRGARAFVEVSPHPVLALAVQETIDASGAGADTVVAGTLRRDHGGLERFLASAAELWVKGVEIDWSALLAAGDARRVELLSSPRPT